MKNISVQDKAGMVDEICIELDIEDKFRDMIDGVVIARAKGNYAALYFSKASSSWGCEPFVLKGYKVAYMVGTPASMEHKSILMYDFKKVI